MAFSFLHTNLQLILDGINKAYNIDDIGIASLSTITCCSCHVALCLLVKCLLIYPFSSCPQYKNSSKYLNWFKK